ncbi:MAG: helix-turn-helix domain-containing protein [Acidimicrobiales bacterium]
MSRSSGIPGILPAAFGRALRAHRLRLGLNQVEFGFLTGYHFSYVGAIERGERNITLGTAEEIALRLGLDPVWMFASES